MLGLGDIVSVYTCSSSSHFYFTKCTHTHTLQVLPGLLLCLSMRFDQLSISTTSLTSSTQQYHIFLHCGKWKYFSLSIIGYTIGGLQIHVRLFFFLLGLFLAGLMAELANYPQPALLYLVPCVLIPMSIKAIIQVGRSLLRKHVVMTTNRIGSF